MKKAAVIIPVYNTAECLEKCIKSITEQTYENLEIIIVDDGSDDGSERICDRLAGEDERIRVIHQQNAGNNRARMRGLIESTAEYVVFVDSDDWIDGNTVERAMEMFERYPEAQVVSFNVRQVDESGTVIRERRNRIQEGYYTEPASIVQDLFWPGEEGSSYGLNPYLIGRIYARKLLEASLHRIPSDITFGEDRALTWTVFLGNPKAVFVDDVLYNYFRRASSITKGEDPDFLSKINKVYNYLSVLFKDQSETLRLQLDDYLLDHILIALNRKIGFQKRAVFYPEFTPDPASFYETGSRVILYGAGKVGRDYYRLFKDRSDILPVLWVDKNWEKNNADFPVHPVDEIRNTDYDRILVAVAQKELFESIREELLEMDIPEDKILWVYPLKKEFGLWWRRLM